MFYSDAKQDQFVANLLSFKSEGTYVDIGSCHSTISNNTFYFDKLNWSGICIEINSEFNNSYSNRNKCCFLNEDALTIDYKKIFKENNFSNVIDYLSLDVDTISYNVLLKIPFDKYKFKVITIEHDAYLYGDEYRGSQRQLLENNGYLLLCSNVYVEQPGYYGKQLPFEDWWIHPDFFNRDIIDKIKSDSINPSEIISKF